MLDRFLIAVESIAESLKVMAAGPTDSAPQADAPAKPRGRPRKAVEPAPTPEQEPEPQAAPVQVQVQVQTPPAFDYNNLKAAIVQLANHSPEGKATAIAILGSYNVAKASDAPAEKWSEMHDKAVAAFDKLTATAVPAADEFA